MTQRLSRTTQPGLPQYPERMIQFGEGNFMRAFVDWQLQQMNKQGLFNGSAAVVVPIGQGLGGLMAEQDNLYTVLLNGIMQEQPVNSREIITSVSRVINPYSDYEAYLALAENDELEFITSNTTEAGIAYQPGDRLKDAPPSSFPAKLTALLYRRFELGKKGFVIIPCELIDRNGEKLREIVRQYAADWNLGEAFLQWLDAENTFCCSLVDRIVPGYPRDKAAELEAELGYLDKLMVTAEPFLFWVIEGPAWLSERLPLAKAGLNVVVTDDMTLYRERKVHLLNGPHTAMVPLAMMAGLETVEDVMNDETFYRFVRGLLDEELIPMLDLPQEELLSYADAVLERFKNPFIRHELASISLNSISKFKTRLLPVLLRYQQERGQLPPLITLALAALLLSYRGDRVKRQDSAEVLEVFDQAWGNPPTFAASILREVSLWGQDLSQVPGLTEAIDAQLHQLQSSDSRAALQQLVRSEA
ncbi:tagaturonate reductase [Paenibacillus jilunlii]|uniref:Altronate oxidoreductase n=1 Tax=Paenibacillus jilunlii TaxID=682956 RepID=A0A1G9PE16_9BACL|nr:tagaturonate reductase [Paenibacillus jilunlii]KWX70693.1 altronate oxidoreductase [Paenibacillus jilunlii]SDL97008.1 tagaturonate reductase [Paenibacillus jilunlii]